MLANGMKSWWYATGKESARNQNALMIEYKLNYAVDVFEDLLEHVTYLSMKQAQPLFEKMTVNKAKLKEMFEKKECSFQVKTM